MNTLQQFKKMKVPTHRKTVPPNSQVLVLVLEISLTYRKYANTWYNSTKEKILRMSPTSIIQHPYLVVSCIQLLDASHIVGCSWVTGQILKNH